MFFFTLLMQKCKQNYIIRMSWKILLSCVYDAHYSYHVMWRVKQGAGFNGFSISEYFLKHILLML